MQKKITFIIVIQALLIIALFWALIFYAKDEYEAHQTEQTAEIKAPNRVTSDEGMNIVSLGLATQQNSGIKTAIVNTANYQANIKSFGSVVAIDSLIEAKANYSNLLSQINTAGAASGSNLAQYARLKALNADDKNVSDMAVQQSQALVNADNANLKAAQTQLKNLQNTLKLQWGEELTNLVFKEKLAPHLAGLLARKNVLVQVSIPQDSGLSAANTAINISPINNSQFVISAIYVSPATTSEPNGSGKTYFYSAPSDNLRIGMRVNVEVLPKLNSTKNEGLKNSAGFNHNSDKDESGGVIIPSSAVVWYAGSSWAYFKKGKTKTGEDQFVRKPVSTEIEVDAGWFNQGFDDLTNAEAEVVVSGAQLLLSEEFKYLIKNENED